MSYSNSLTSELIKLLDNTPGLTPSTSSILQPSSTVYLTIKQMLNLFKKQNESRIIQNKIYNIELPSKQTVSLNKNKQLSVVTLKCLFSFSNNNTHVLECLEGFIKIKPYIGMQLQKQLITLISKQCLKLPSLKQFLILTSKILKTKECINDRKLYHQIFKQIIQKINSTMEIFDKQCVKNIWKFVIGLPYHDIQVLKLIAIVFDKIVDLQDFNELKMLYKRIYDKVQNSIKADAKNDHLRDMLLDTMMKITIDDHLATIKQNLKENHERTLKKQLNSIDDFKFEVALQKQAVNKILTEIKLRNIHKVSRNLQTMQQEEIPQTYEKNQISEKDKKIIQFIFCALESQTLLTQSQSTKVWSHFISWYHILPQNSPQKQQIDSLLAPLCEKLLQFPKSALKTIKILLQIELNPAQKSLPSGISVSMASQIQNSVNVSQTTGSSIGSILPSSLTPQNLAIPGNLPGQGLQPAQGIQAMTSINANQTLPIPQSIGIQGIQGISGTHGTSSTQTMSAVTSTISNFFTRHIITHPQLYRKYLCNEKVETLMAAIFVRDSVGVYEQLIFSSNFGSIGQTQEKPQKQDKQKEKQKEESTSSNLPYIDIIIKGFDVQWLDMTSFFQRIMSTQQKKNSLGLYLNSLLLTKPKKFRLLFTKIDSYKSGEIFELHDHFLLHFFIQSAIISMQVAIAVVREMGSYPPSLYTIEILNMLIKKSPASELPRITAQTAQTLNIILCTYALQDLPTKFKKDLREIISSQIISMQKVFTNVPKTMMDALTAFYSRLGQGGAP